jgi:hypothetical protein
MKSIILLFLALNISIYSFAIDGRGVNQYDLEIGSWIIIIDKDFSEYIFYVYGFGNKEDFGRRFLISFSCKENKAYFVDYNPRKRKINSKKLTDLPEIILIKEEKLKKEIGIPIFHMWKKITKKKKWVKKYKKIYKKSLNI